MSEESKEHPAAAVEWWPIGNVSERDKNPRTHSPRQIKLIAANIRRRGWTTALLVDADGVLIAGHGRLAAARRMKAEAVPVMVARGWSSEDIRHHVIADNRLAELAGWDKTILAEEADELAAIGVDLDDLLDGMNLDAPGVIKAAEWTAEQFEAKVVIRVTVAPHAATAVMDAIAAQEPGAVLACEVEEW